MEITLDCQQIKTKQSLPRTPMGTKKHLYVLFEFTFNLFSPLRNILLSIFINTEWCQWTSIHQSKQLSWWLLKCYIQNPFSPREAVGPAAKHCTKYIVSDCFLPNKIKKAKEENFDHTKLLIHYILRISLLWNLA